MQKNVVCLWQNASGATSLSVIATLLPKSGVAKKKGHLDRPFFFWRNLFLTVLALFTVGGIPGRADEIIGLNPGSIEQKTELGVWNTGLLYVGYFGSGTLDIGETGQVFSTDSYLGYMAGSSGSVNVSGTWINSGRLYVGRDGGASLSIYEGGYVSSSDDSLIGGNATVTVSGGTWSALNLFVSNGGLGILFLNGGYISNGSSYIGNASGYGVAMVSSGTWSNINNLYLGHEGMGTLLVGEEGVVTAGGTTFVAYSAQSSGTLGLFGSAESRGILVTGQIVRGDGAAATLLLNGGLLRALRNESDFLSNFQPGEIIIDEEGVYIDTNGFDIGINSSLGGNGLLVKQGEGNLTMPGHIGSTVVESGKLTISSNSVVSQGTLVVKNGTLVSYENQINGADVIIGSGSGNSGSAIITGGTWSNTGFFNVGQSGTGTLIVNGARLTTSSYSDIGYDSGTGSVIITNGTWNGYGFRVGYSTGTGSLTIEQSYIANGSRVYIGYNYGAGSVTITDSVFENVLDLYVGQRAQGTLTINSGTVSARDVILGFLSGTATLNMNGGTLRANSLTVGLSGYVTFLLNGGLVVTERVTVGESASYAQTITLSGFGDNRGTLETGVFSKYNGTATVEFDGGVLRARNHRGSFLYGFQPGEIILKEGGAYFDSNGFDIGINSSLDGSGPLVKLGEGNLTLNAINTYTGNTEIKGGSLTVSPNATINSGTILVHNGSLAINGGTLFNDESTIGTDVLFSANAILAGGSWTTNILNVGANGTGELTIGGESFLNSTSSYLGRNAGSSGIVKITGGTWNTPHLYIGEGGTGSLSVEGGFVSSEDAILGNSSDSHGSVIVTGGTFKQQSSLTIGKDGSGELSLDGGHISSRVTYIGSAGGTTLTSFGTVIINSGTWEGDTLYTAAKGTARLTVNGGEVGADIRPPPRGWRGNG